MLRLKHSRNTVGCRIKGEIFIHPELYKYPKLYKAIIKHESNHTSGTNLSDVRMDIINDELKGVKKDFYKFMLSHPRTLLGWLPITKIGKYWAFDLQLTVVWVMSIGFVWYIIAHI